MLAGRNRLAVHGVTAARWAVSSVLLAVAIMLTWQLLSPLVRRAPAAQGDAQSAMAHASPARPRSVLIADIQDAHLFGDASAGPATVPVSTVSGSVSVTGIVYSTQEQDSVALLSVAGSAVVSHVGTQLATGQTVTGIHPDRIELRGRDGLVSLLLDIKQADPNQRISPGQFASVSVGGDAADAELGAPGSQPAIVQNTSAVPSLNVGLVPTHFVSLKSIRGAHAARRFSGVDMPKIKGGPHR